MPLGLTLLRRRALESGIKLFEIANGGAGPFLGGVAQLLTSAFGTAKRALRFGMISLAGSCLAQECITHKGDDLEQLRAFLSAATPQNRSDPFCTEFALFKLGAERDAASIPILLSYMSFKREPDDSEKALVFHRMGSPYPSVNALSSFGPGSGELPKELLGEVVTYLSKPRSAIEKSNAVEVISYYYREKPAAGVAFLIEESKKPTYSSQALRSAAELLAYSCDRRSRDACLSVLARK